MTSSRASGARARARTLRAHTAEHRAIELEELVAECAGARVAMTLEAPAAQDGDIAALGPWFHNLHLPDGRQTAPGHPLGDFPSFKWRELAPSLPQDLTGWSALDIGCNAGFYSFELARRGAAGPRHRP